MDSKREGIDNCASGAPGHLVPGERPPAARSPLRQRRSRSRARRPGGGFIGTRRILAGGGHAESKRASEPADYQGAELGQHLPGQRKVVVSPDFNSSCLCASGM